MAVTYINFVPSLLVAPQFQVTLDGAIYTVIMTWNLSAQRYYLNIYSLGGTLILCRVLTGSPVGSKIQSASWKNGSVTIETSKPHKLMENATVRLTIVGMTPDTLNGSVLAFITGPTTFTYPLAADPGATTIFGTAEQNLNLVAGLFASTLVFRTANSQFEVSP